MPIILTKLILMKKPQKTEEKESKEDSKAKENYEISFSGSSTLAPVISKISTTFIEKNVTWDKVDSSLPDKNITIYVSAGGSGAGVKGCVGQRCKLRNVSA